MQTGSDRLHTPQWIEVLSEEDLTFLKRFLLASGSLKELASIYGVSYPTLRLRLDRLIQKVEVAEKFQQAGPFERQLRLMLADGAIDETTFRQLREAHFRELNASPNGGSLADESGNQTEPRSSMEP